MSRSLAVAAFLLLVSNSPALAQQVQQAGVAADRRELLFEFSGGIGYTSVDLEKWGGSGSTNEELLLSQFDARLFFARAAGFQLGLEGGYRYFFYYEVPYTSYMLYRDVAATRLGTVARRSLNGVVSFDIGAAAYLFDDFVDMGISGAMVFRIPAGKVGIPLHLRTDLVFDDQLVIGSGMTLGVAFKR
jgi:hypothetical protein